MNAIATLAGGCFWCTEAVFLQLQGVIQVVSGYTGGTVKNPSYREVCTGRTGHAEAVQITFDPAVISYSELLEVFFSTHDPTTLNRQGNDVGNQYRSAVFYHDDSQQKQAQSVKNRFEKEGVYSAPIVTTLEAAGPFYPAEEEHKNYFYLHPDQPYCAAVISPKVAAFRQKFKNRLKK